MRQTLKCRRWLVGVLAIAAQFCALGALRELCRASPLDRNGKITGTVVDPIAAVIPNATVIFKAAGAPESRAVTAALGNFEANLPPNLYEVRVEVRGFVRERRRVELQPEQVVHLTFTLKVAASDTTAPRDTVDEVDIPDSDSRLRIEYGSPIRRAQIEKQTTYEDVSLLPAGGPRAVVAKYREVTIWASKLELSQDPTIVHASGYVLLDDGINLPKHVSQAVLRFEKGKLKLETPP